MIVLDTNVVSEAMKPSGNPVVLNWMNSQTIETMYLSSITLAELLYGIGALPAGRRKSALTEAFEDILDLFRGRILAFDADAARRYAQLAVKARAVGNGLPKADGYIAAIADTHGFALATRDTGLFAAAGVPVLDPWAAPVAD